MQAQSATAIDRSESPNRPHEHQPCGVRCVCRRVGAVEHLNPYARNPRKNDEAVKSVAASIREFGFLVPLVIDAGHEIVTGHTRYKAAQSLGLKEVPCVVADELSDAQIKAFRLADNKVGELASWDMDLLPLELADIQMPMTDFGFEVISDEDFSENFTLDAGEKKPFQQISLTVHDEQAKLILAAIKYVYDHNAVTETFTNENHNGNGLYEVVREWAAIKQIAIAFRRLNAMRGLTVGINAGRSGVIFAVRSAVCTAVNAVKSALKLKLPSKVFEDETGVMTMRGWECGALNESKA